MDKPRMPLGDALEGIKNWLQRRPSRRRDAIKRVEQHRPVHGSSTPWGGQDSPYITVVGKHREDDRLRVTIDDRGRLTLQGRITVMLDVGDPSSLDRFAALMTAIYSAELGELTNAPTAAKEDN